MRKSISNLLNIVHKDILQGNCGLCTSVHAYAMHVHFFAHTWAKNHTKYKIPVKIISLFTIEEKKMNTE